MGPIDLRARGAGSSPLAARKAADVAPEDEEDRFGAVIAGTRWDAPMRRMEVPPAREGNWEDAFHRTGPEDKALVLDPLTGDDDALRPRGHRAIGVVYHPEREAWGNYVPTVLPRRYDVLLHVDRSEALTPLHVPPRHAGIPETYPWGA